MREEEDGLARSDAIMYTFLKISNFLCLRLIFTAHNIWIPAQEIKDTTKHTSTTSIIKSKQLNKSRSIKINDALTQTFTESELVVVHINEIREESYNQVLVSISSPWVSFQVQAQAL